MSFGAGPAIEDPALEQQTGDELKDQLMIHRIRNYTELDRKLFSLVNLSFERLLDWNGVSVTGAEENILRKLQGMLELACYEDREDAAWRR